jgi:hypothetical protein
LGFLVENKPSGNHGAYPDPSFLVYFIIAPAALLSETLYFIFLLNIKIHKN